MSTIGTNSEDLILNADGSGSDIKFKSNGTEVASISDGGVVTATSFAGSGANLTGVGVAGITSTADATAITITSDEKIGIGTASPACVAKGLHIQTSSAGTLPTLQADADDVIVEGSTPGITLMGATNGGGMLAFGDTADADIGQIFYYHADNSMRFKTNATEAMRITSTGRVQINAEALGTNFGGAAASIGHTSTSPLLELHVNHASAFGAVKFMNGNGEAGSISMNSGSVAYNTSSDYRLKENVDYTWDATLRLKQLKPARFNFIADDTNTLVDGFIAHEVSSIVPEAVTGEKDAVDDDGNIEPQGIDQSKLVPLLVKAMQEQQTTIESLTARITALEG
jgi:hypothetical protein